MTTKGGIVEGIEVSGGARSLDRGCDHNPSCLECPFPVCQQDSSVGIPGKKLTEAFERGVRDRLVGVSTAKSSYARDNLPVRAAWTKGWWSADKWIQSRDLNRPLRVQQVAAILGIHQNTVRRMDGHELHSFRVGLGGHRRFRIGEILEYIERKKIKKDTQETEGSAA